MKTTLLLLLALCFCKFTIAQEADSLLTNRLKAIESGANTYYNIDGVDIFKHIYYGTFTEPVIARVFRQTQVSSLETRTTEKEIDMPNVKVTETDSLAPNLIVKKVNYYVALDDNKIAHIQFGYVNTTSPELEHILVPLIANNKVPAGSYYKTNSTTVNFAGHPIVLWDDCIWNGINNLQCPYRGQMNWSLHKTLASAQAGNQKQMAITKSRKFGKIVTEKQVPVVFEGVSTNAQLLVFDFTEEKKKAQSLESIGDRLTVYYIAAKVRDQYLSCVLSFWNNDKVSTTTNLPPFLEKVMKLK